MHPDKIGNSLVVFCFSNASRRIVVFMINNSLPSEEIHDSHQSLSTRPQGNPVSSSMLLFHFPKAAWASLCLSRLHTLLSIRVHAFYFCVARQYTSLVPQSDLVPAHTLALLLITDKKVMFTVFSWGQVGKGGQLSSHTSSRIWAQVLWLS